MFLRYNELRVAHRRCRDAFDARDARRRAARRPRGRVRDPPARWVGTATEIALAFPYLTLWGFPEKFHRPPADVATSIAGWPRRPASSRGRRAVVDSLDGVRPGAGRRDPRLPDDEPRLGRAVHEDRRARHRRGGVASHPAVVAREFGSRRSSARRTRRSGSRRATACASTAPRGVGRRARASGDAD